MACSTQLRAFLRSLLLSPRMAGAAKDVLMGHPKTKASTITIRIAGWRDLPIATTARARTSDESTTRFDSGVSRIPPASSVCR